MPKVPSPPNGLSDERPLPPDCADKYAVQRRLGDGGFGVVYLALHRVLKRPVAIKVLHSEILSQSEQVERFRAEAQIAAAVDHPNVVRVTDSGAAAGVPWIAFQYVPGRSVRALVDNGPLPWRQAVKIAVQVLEGLAAAHALGILHRDIKPDNVLQGEGGNVLISDFGIAKWSESGVRTKTGMVLGTPCYLAPEQARGEPATAATDLYAVAVMLFELLTGKPPYEDANPIRILEQHLNGPIPKASARKPGLPRALDSLLERGLAKAPRDRASSARELAAELNELLRQPTGISARIPAPVVAAPSAPPRPGLALAVVAGALLAAAAATLMPARTPPPPDPVPTAAPATSLAAQVAALEASWHQSHDPARLEELETLLDAAPVIETHIRVTPALAHAFAVRLREPLEAMMKTADIVNAKRTAAAATADILERALSTIDTRRKFASDLRRLDPKLWERMISILRPLQRKARVHTRAALGLELSITDQIPLTVFTGQLLQNIRDFKVLTDAELEGWIATVRKGRARDWRVPYLQGSLEHLLGRDGPQLEAFAECVRLLRAQHGAAVSSSEREWLTYDILESVVSGLRARDAHQAACAEILAFVNELPQPRSEESVRRIKKFEKAYAEATPATFDLPAPSR